MKYYLSQTPISPLPSPPSRGAWIEITRPYSRKFKGLVAPLAGAWIEIPIRRRVGRQHHVAPLAGGVD